MSSFVIVHVADSHQRERIELPRPASHQHTYHAARRVPGGPDSDSDIVARQTRHRSHAGSPVGTRQSASDPSPSTSNRSRPAVPPLSFMTFFTNVNVGRPCRRCDRARRRLVQRDGHRAAPTCVPPTQYQPRPRSPAAADSDSDRRPRYRQHPSPPVTRSCPMTGVGPVAVNVQSVATAVPPLSFTTCFTNVNCRRDVVIVDRARRPLTQRERHRLPVLRPTDTRPGTRRITRRPRLRQCVRARADRAAVTGAEPGHTRSIGVGPSPSTSTPSQPPCRRCRSSPSSPTSTAPAGRCC